MVNLTREVARSWMEEILDDPILRLEIVVALRKLGYTVESA